MKLLRNVVFILMLLHALVEAQSFDGPAQLPSRVTFSLTYPSQPGATIYTPTAGDACCDANSIQAKVNTAAANCGSTGAIVSIPANTTNDFTSNYLNLPATNCDGTHWVVIQSANLSSLPAQGTRVGPSNSSNLAQIEATGNQARVIDAQDYPTPGSQVSGYWLAGLEVIGNYTGGAAGTTYAIRFGDTCAGAGDTNSRSDGGCPITSGMTSANLDSRFVLERSYVHPVNETFTSTYGLIHALGGDAGNVAIEDSTIVALAYTQAQAWSTAMTFGPVDIGNNTLEGSGESATEIGADPQPITNALPQNIYFHHNYIFKPTAWLSLCQAQNGGVCPGTGAVDRRNWWECKGGRFVLVEGNYFKNDDSAFYSVQLNPVDSTGVNAMGWASCNDITFRYNWFDSSSGVMDVDGPTNLGNSGVALVNDTTTGTFLNKLTKMTASYWNNPHGIVSSAGDTSGVVGTCSSNCGTSGNSTIANIGNISCVFDNGVTLNHWVQISSTVAGDCHDVGASKPSSGQIIGQVQTTNASPGTYLVTVWTDSSGIPGYYGESVRRVSVHDNVSENVDVFWFSGIIITGVTVSGGNAVYAYSSYGGPPPGPGSTINITGFTNSGNNGSYGVASWDSVGQTITITATTQVTETHAALGSSAAGHGGFVDFATGDTGCGGGVIGSEVCQMHDISVIHNSAVSLDSNTSGHCFDFNSGTNALVNNVGYKWRILNNICPSKSNGLGHAQGTSNSQAWLWLAAEVSDSGTAGGTGSAWDYNIITNLTFSGYAASSFQPNACNYSGATGCTGNQALGWASSMSSVGFTNYNSGLNGWQTNNYKLTNASTYHNTGSDGTDPGANIATVNQMTCGAIVGVSCSAPFGSQHIGTSYQRGTVVIH